MLGAIETLQVRHPGLRIKLSQGSEQVGRKVDHKEGEADSIGHRSLFDGHEILQTEVLLGVSEGELDLEAQAIVLHDLLGSKGQVAGKEDHMSFAPARQVSAHEDYDVDGVGKEFMQAVGMIALCHIIALRHAAK